MKGLIFVSVLFITALSPTVVYGQIQWTDFENPTIYTKEDGLLSNVTNDVIEDEQGFLWIATGNGISVFDGFKFNNHPNFYVNGSKHIIGEVKNLVFDKKHKLIFIGTQNGVLVSTISTIKFQPLEELFSFVPKFDSAFNSLLIDDKNTLWVGTMPGGLHKIEINKRIYQQYNLFNEQYIDIENSWLNDIRTIEEDNLNSQWLWLGTNMGLVKFNKATSEHQVYNFQNNKDLYHNIINTIITTDNKIIVGSNYKGWYIMDRYSNETYQIISDTDREVFYTIYSFYPDENGNLWISSPQGLKELDIDTEHIVDFRFNERQDGNVYGLSLIDSRGIMWYCDKSGLIKYDPNSYLKLITFENNSKMDHSILVRKIIELDNDYYVCADKSSGIYKIDGTDFSISILPTDIDGLSVKSSKYLYKDMIQMSDEEFLILGYQEIFIFDTKSNETAYSPIQVPDSSSIFINKGVKDLENNYWITTNHNGLYRLNYQDNDFEKVIEPFKGKTPRDHNLINHIEIDSNNNLWIGQSSTSVLDLNTKKLYCLNPEFDYTPELEFGNFLETGDRRMWIANIVDGLSFAEIDNYKKGLTKVADGSYTGVYPYNDSLIWNIKNGKLGYTNIKTLNQSEVHLSSNSTITGPIFKMKDSNFMIGVENGLLVYDPNKHRNYEGSQRTYIKEIRANNIIAYSGKQFDVSDFEFRSGTKSLMIEIGIMAFNNMDENAIQYKTDDTWNDLGNSMQINLSNLKQGPLTLDLRLIDVNGDISAFNTYNFSVKPYWYTSSLALVIYILIVGGIIFALYKFNLNRRLALAESAKAREMDELKSKLFANISHEFRTPLTLIKGLTSMLNNNSGKAQIEKLTQGIEQNSDQLLSLVNQMLDLSALDANKMEVSYKNGDIVSFIQKCVELYKSYSESKLQKLEFNSEMDELYMDFDDDKLQKILNNLLSNAIKFTSKNGMVSVNLRRSEDQLKISVSDTGEGIVSSQLPYLFDRYFKSPNNHGQVGTGIGLALTKDLVELLGGSIKVKSKLGEGSNFIIRLPIRNRVSDTDVSHAIPFVKEEVTYKDKVKINVEAQSEYNIMLVEDNKDIQSYVEEVLSPKYGIIIADNGLEALEKAENEDIQFIISDVMMPKMDGFEFCERIKSDLNTSHIPFIMLSARTNTQDKQRAYKLGVDAYLTKPFHKDELILIINNLIEKQHKQKSKLLKLLALQKPEDKTLDINKLDLDLMTSLQTIILESDTKLTADEIAGKLLISRSKLHQKVKTLTGKSLTHYANHLKIEKAKHLLNTSELQIKEIAYKVGFQSATYFIRLFKKATGIPPAAYRSGGNLIDNSS